MDNFNKIMKAVETSDFDALLIISPVNRHYVSGFDSSDGLILVTNDRCWFFTDSRYIEAAEKSITSAQVILISGSQTYLKSVREIIEKYEIESIGFEEEYMTYSEYINWNNKLNVKFIPAQTLFKKLRMIKNKDELNAMIAAQRIAEKSFLEIIPLISMNITEKELAAELLFRFQKNGGDDKSFDTIIVSGTHSSMPHGVPANEKISKGFLTIDFGVRAGGWCSDTTRTLCVGTPTEEMRLVYDTVLSAQLAGIASVRAGVPANVVDGVARNIISSAGFGDNFGHSFGHGLGLEIHEYPYVSPNCTDPLPAGAVVSAEPGIYLPNKYGVRIEDVLYITENGAVNITDLPKELIIL